MDKFVLFQSTRGPQSITKAASGSTDGGLAAVPATGDSHLRRMATDDAARVGVQGVLAPELIIAPGHHKLQLQAQGQGEHGHEQGQCQGRDRGQAHYYKPPSNSRAENTGLVNCINTFR